MKCSGESREPSGGYRPADIDAALAVLHVTENSSTHDYITRLSDSFFLPAPFQSWGCANKVCFNYESSLEILLCRVVHYHDR